MTRLASSILLCVIAAGSLLAGARSGIQGALPQRIVSLVPAVTEMLFAIGAGPQVVAVSSYDTYPPEVRQLPRVGALIDPDLERILALKPDLVVGYATQVDVLAQISRARIDVYEYEHAGLADIPVTISRLGARTGHGAEAARLVARIETKMEEIRRRVAARTRPRTLLVFGRDADALRGIHASGGVGFLHDMLTVAGGENVFADVQRQSIQATSELVLARGPEVILEIRGNPMSEQERARHLAAWRALSAVPAVRTGRLVMITDPRTVVPGPRVAEGTELLARALHPGAFASVASFQFPVVSSFQFPKYGCTSRRGVRHPLTRETGGVD